MSATQPRLRACVEAWPDAHEGGYDPRCCRFPKSCSADVYDPAHVTAEDLECPAMTAPEPTPTAEHIDAVARVVHRFVESHDRDEMVAELLTSTDATVHAALAANLPADVMLDALVRAGVLTEEQHCAHARAAQADGDYRSYTCEDAGTHCPPPRLVTRWEVAP